MSSDAPAVKTLYRREPLLLAFLITTGLLVLGISVFQIATYVVPLPSALFHPPEDTVSLVDCRGQALATLPSVEAREQRHLRLAEMGRWLPVITVALEDNRFYQHRGVDLRATASAILRNLRAGRIVSGASTITQQLIKIVSKRGRRSWRAKLYEELAAVRLERLWTKDKILEEYLNRSDYGNRRIGPAAAASAYFNKLPKNLTLPEAIYLAGLPQAPTRFNPWRHPEVATDKYHRSLDRLNALAFDTTIPVARMQMPPPLYSHQALLRAAPHFVDAVTTNHLKFSPGVVETTLNLDLQRYVEQLVRIHLANLAPRQVSQAAVIILDANDGAVCAMVGSRGYGAAGAGEMINGTMIYRSCGSTLKPFLYLYAIESRVLTAASLLPDTPDAVRAEYIDYDPVNYDKRFWGPVRVREALANSLNVPAVVALSRVGARKMFLNLENCGLKFARSFSEYGAGLILGNAEIRLLDLAAAYTVFAGHGLAVEPRFLRTDPVRHRFIASTEAIAIVADILADNTAREKTFGAFSPLAFEGHRVPCKTGTSSGFRDAWTVGVTGQHVVGVWMGNFDGRPMDEIAAVTGPAPLCHEIVEHLFQRGDTSVPAPFATSQLTQCEVCSVTGLLPVPASPGTVHEWFLAGTEPKEDARHWFRQINGRVRLVLPGSYALWCQSLQNYLGAEIETGTRLRIVSPAPNSKFIIDPNLSRSQQALRLVAAGGSNEDLVWKVDGETIPASNGWCFWPLLKGKHTVEVQRRLDRASAEFTVE